VAETIPNFTASGWQVLVVPIGTPAAILSKVSADLRKVVSGVDFKKRLAAIGNYSRAMTPEEVLAFVAKEQQIWQPVLEKISAK
jgi:tripartite-type tricarboxylate transporter receptor subunit TctC